MSLSYSAQIKSPSASTKQLGADSFHRYSLGGFQIHNLIAVEIGYNGYATSAVGIGLNWFGCKRGVGSNWFPATKSKVYFVA